MAKFKVHPVSKADPEIRRCAECNGVLASWEKPYGGLCHLCADDPLMVKRK